MSSIAIRAGGNRTLSDKKLRNFGLVLSTLFFLIFYILRPWITGEPSNIFWPVSSVSLIVWALVRPSSMQKLFDFWTFLGNVLGAINSRIILGIMFFLVITPIGFLMRLMGKDLLDLKIDRSATSYKKIPQSILLNKHPY